MTDIFDKVSVELGERGYDIHIGGNLIRRAGEYLAPHLRRPRVAVVTDENVAPLHLPVLQSALAEEKIEESHLVLPTGEVTKSWPFYTQTVEWLLEQKIERSDLIVVLGGGVIGDLVGFAAASVRRGVRFVQIPTTLLAQVDSSVGGKTGLNTPQGKNLVGAFYQPSIVLSDISVLASLPPRDFLSGYGEIMKYGLLGNRDFFEWLEQAAPCILRQKPEALIKAIKTSCQMKADIVAKDETEAGERALLNLGHTFCHALEAATGYNARLLHGEGVAIGCALAFDVSARLGLCSQEHSSRIRAHMRTMGLKTDISMIEGDLPDAQALIALMGQDKKTVRGQLTFIMARDIGDAFIARDVPLDVVSAVLKDSAAA